MAIQFPNFLGAALVKPDYSGIGDSVSNYYAGRAMPKDDLIKQIQAQFAQPNAEATLQGLKLGNQSTGLSNQKLQLEIAKYKRDMAIQQELERQISQAMRGGNVGGSQSITPQPMMPAQNQPAPSAPMNPALARAFQQMNSNSGDMNAPNASSLTPNAPYQSTSQQMPASFTPPVNNATPAAPAQASAPQPLSSSGTIQVITPGTDKYSKIDELWDQNPLSRALLKTKGFDKKTDIKFDQKTGQTRVMTTYPSGKTTLEIIGGAKNDDGIPLTNAMVTQHQRVISSVDNAIPQLKKLRDLTEHSNIYLGGNFTATAAQVKYKRLVQSLKDNLLGAYSLRPTEHGLQTVEDMLAIGGHESEAEYKDAINDLIKDLEEKKKYSAGEVKRSNKIQPINRSDTSNQTYSSDEWETTNE